MRRIDEISEAGSDVIEFCFGPRLGRDLGQREYNFRPGTAEKIERPSGKSKIFWNMISDSTIRMKGYRSNTVDTSDERIAE